MYKVALKPEIWNIVVCLLAAVILAPDGGGVVRVGHAMTGNTGIFGFRTVFVWLHGFCRLHGFCTAAWFLHGCTIFARLHG